MADGTTPYIRAEKFGTVTASPTAGVNPPQVLEYTLYEVEEMFYVLAMMLIDDRSKHVWSRRITQDAVMNDLTTFTQIGIAVSEYRDPTDLLLNKSVDTMTTVLFASNYVNAADVSTCQPTQSFGGGACEPDTTTIDLFNAQNAFRINPVAVDRLKHKGRTKTMEDTDIVTIPAGGFKL